MQCAKTILKRLFRVYAHIYHEHFGQVVDLSEEAHLNTSFKHFIFFVQEFNLIDKRELAPLQELIDSLTERDIRTYQQNLPISTNNKLSKQDQLQIQLEQHLNLQQENQNNFNHQSNQLNSDNQPIKYRINVPQSNNTKNQDFIESTSTTNSFNSITTSINEINSDLAKQQEIQNSIQYSSGSNSRASSNGNSKLESNAYF